MMAKLLFDEKTLGSIIDPILVSKASSSSMTQRFKLLRMRGKLIEELDHKISIAIFRSFTKEQGAEFNYLLDIEADEAAYDEFFTKHGIDDAKIMQETAEEFLRELMAMEV